MSNNNMQDRFPGLTPQPSSQLPDIAALIKAKQQQERAAAAAAAQQQQQAQASAASSSMNDRFPGLAPQSSSSSGGASQLPDIEALMRKRQQEAAAAAGGSSPMSAHNNEEDSPSSSGATYNHSKYTQVIKSGLDIRTTPYAGVVAPDVVGTENEDDAEDKLPPVEQGVWMGLVSASHVQMTLSQQMWRIPFFFLFCIAIQCFILNFTTIRMPDPVSQLQLPDIGFELLPRRPELEQVTALLLLSMNILGGITIIGLWRVATHRTECSC